MKSRFSTRLSVAVLPAVLLAVGCGGGTPEAESPEALDDSVAEDTAAEEAAEPEAEAEAEPEGPLAIPGECHNGDSPCTTDPKWAQALCQDVYPAVALYLNQPDSPFSRGYLTRKVQAVNASGGATSGNEWLVFDEQVILVMHRSANLGGMSVSGAEGGYDAIRWDGSCVTLDGSEVRLQKPPTPKHTHIDWRYLGKDIQSALKQVPSVKEAYIARKQECKGAYSGAVSKLCVKKDEALQRTIIKAVQSGEVQLPVPELRP